MAERLSLSEEKEGVQELQKFFGKAAGDLLQRVRIGQGVQVSEIDSTIVDAGEVVSINVTQDLVTMSIKMSETRSFTISGRLQETPVILRTYVEGQDISITVGTTTVRMNLG